MLILPVGKRHGLSYTQIWYPTDPGVIRTVMQSVTTVAVCNSSFDAQSAGLLNFRSKWEDWWTTYIRLELPPDELRRRLDPKSCRYEIRKSEKLPCVVSVNDRTDDAYDLIQNFIKRKGYRNPMTTTEWKEYRRTGDIHSIQLDGQTIAAHVILLDPPERTRLLISATCSRKDEKFRHWVGPMNRRLHWEEILFYKSRSYAEYDFGGIWPDPANQFHSIGKFKTSFGGEVKKLHNFVVIKNPLLRTAWKTARAAKRTAVYLKSIIRRRG
jgi:hypothetical protein